MRARWMDWREAGQAITELRRRVYIAEQGFGEDMVHHPGDADGLPLCALDGDEIVAALAAYLYEPGAPELEELGLPKVDGLSVQIGKRVEAASHRGALLSERLGTSMMRQVCESLRPARFFLTVRGRHRELIDRYARRGFVRHADIGPLTVMTIEGRQALEDMYVAYRALGARSPRDGTPLAVPSLVRFLADHGRDHLPARDALAAQNVYLEPLSPEEELPRLAAQSRLVAAEQRPRLAATAFPARVAARRRHRPRRPPHRRGPGAGLHRLPRPGRRALPRTTRGGPIPLPLPGRAARHRVRHRRAGLLPRRGHGELPVHPPAQPRPRPAGAGAGAAAGRPAVRGGRERRHLHRAGADPAHGRGARPPLPW
ncbi:hypothetical protein GCM10010486_88160 [Nonomuraea roseoviolacea subsp. carminata]